MAMDPEIKRALLLSALVCPGLGQWKLGKRGLGAAFMAWATAGVVLLGWRIYVLLSGFYYEMTAELMDTGGYLPDPSSFQDVHTEIYVSNWWVILAISVVWIWSVVDLYPRNKS